MSYVTVCGVQKAGTKVPLRVARKQGVIQIAFGPGVGWQDVACAISHYTVYWVSTCLELFSLIGHY